MHEREGLAMSWMDANRYYQALRTAERDLDASPDGILVWRPHYADLFGSPDRLLLALRSRWENMMRAQIDRIWEVDGAPTKRMRELAEEHPGLVRAMARLALNEREHSMQPDVSLAGAA